MDESGSNSNSNNPCTLLSNPLDIDVVLTQVLDYVGEDKTLLNCRLVNRKWNSHVVLKLRKKDTYFISLDTSNIMEYIELINKSQQTSSSLPLSVRLEENIDDVQKNYDIFIADVRRILEIFGSSCIETFKVSTGAWLVGFNWEEMMELILSCSPGLKHLTIKPYHGNECLNPVNLDDKPITFPSLHSLEFWGIVKNPTLLVQLVNSSPALQKLYIDLNANEMGFNVRTGTNSNPRLAAAYNGFMPCRLRHLTELNLVLGDDSTYQVIQLHQFPILEKLKVSFNIKVSEITSNLLVQFLTTKCPVLNSLHFHFNINHMEVLRTHDLVHEFPSNFPVLPKVTHLGLSYSGTEDGWSYIDNYLRRYELDPPVFVQIDNLTSGHFPNLSSVTVGFGLGLYSRAGFAGFDAINDDNNEGDEFMWGNPRLVNFVSFDKVSKLTVVFNNTLEQLDHQFRHLLPIMDEYDSASQLHELFPNVTSLVLDNQIRPDEKFTFQQQENYIVACLDSLSSGLETLTINNYIKDWFCNPSSPLTNIILKYRLYYSLKAIIIPPIQKHYKDIISSNGGSFAYKNAIRHPKVIVNGITLTEHDPLLGSITHAKVIINGVTLNQEDPLLVDSNNITGTDNNIASSIANLGMFLSNISLQLTNISMAPEVAGVGANTLWELIELHPSPVPPSSPTMMIHENVYLLTKCLEMIEYSEPRSFVGQLAKQLLDSLSVLNNDGNNSNNSSSIVSPTVTSSLDIKELMNHLPNLEQIQVGQKFLCHGVMQELKINYPKLKIQLIE